MKSPKSWLAVIFIILLTSGCVIDARERDTLIGPVRTVDLAVPEDARIVIRVPAGDVNISNSDDDRIRGEMRIMCPDVDSRCAKRLGELEFFTETAPGRVRVALSLNRIWQFRHGHVEVALQVPADHRLEVDVSAGDVDVDVANCVTADIEAGDASFNVPAGLVRSVRLDTGIGDASLSVDGNWHSGRRALLVGAEIEWDQGEGDCPMVVDLQTGDLRVELTGTPEALRAGNEDIRE